MGSFTPIIVGISDVKNASVLTSSALEPAALILQAIRGASADSRLPARSADALLAQVDSLAVVRVWTWPYDDLPGLLARKLGLAARPQHTRYPDGHGGNQPARLLDEAARRIASGESRVAVVAGGEALASRASLPSLAASALQAPPLNLRSFSERE